jgi:hypothetical protein
MTYLDFTLDHLQREFGIRVHDRPLFEPLGDLAPSAQLQNHLQAISGLAIVSEKARSEFIVAPILFECRERMQRRINIFSGTRLDADPERGLKGECDFIVARSESRYVFQAPIMVILEAKKHDMDDGLAQCAAQLLGAWCYNEQAGSRWPTCTVASPPVNRGNSLKSPGPICKCIRSVSHSARPAGFVVFDGVLEGRGPTGDSGVVVANAVEAHHDRQNEVGRNTGRAWAI